MFIRISILFLCVFAFLNCDSSAVAQDVPATLKTYFSDPQGLLADEQETEVEAELSKLAANGSARIFVYLTGEVPDGKVQKFARKIFDNTQFSMGSKASSVLMVLEVNTNSVAFVVGDLLFSRVSQEAISFIADRGVVPKLERGNLRGAVFTGIELVGNLLVAEDRKPAAKAPAMAVRLKSIAIPLLLIALSFGYVLDRMLEIVLGNFLSSLCVAAATFGASRIFAPVSYSIIAAAAAFVIAYFDVFGGAEPVERPGGSGGGGTRFGGGQ